MLTYTGNILFLYSDPGSGLLLLQLLLGGVLGAFFYLRLYSKKTKNFLFRKKGAENMSLDEVDKVAVEPETQQRSSEPSEIVEAIRQ